MVNIMNQYLNNIHLVADDITKNLLSIAISEHLLVSSVNVIIRSNKYIVDIKLNEYTVDNSIAVMNVFMEQTRFPYSSFYVRFNEGNQVRYRYASCKEDKQGYYCDVVIS